MAVSIIVAGAGGRMGIEIARAALGQSGVSLASGIDQAGHPSVGTDMGIAAVGSACGALVHEAASFADFKGRVVIDFTAPAATTALARSASANGAAGVIVGTTGCGAAEIEVLSDVARTIPVVFSPNMSLGVNLLFYLTGIVAARLKDSFDIEIVEAHHMHKKDAPSGTARRLAEIAAEAMGSTYNDAVCTGRDGMVGERPHGQIGVHAVRGGDIVGDHAVLFAGQGERIELKHVAHSRATFAQGAITAAQWVCGKSPALYSMANVLGL